MKFVTVHDKDNKEKNLPENNKTVKENLKDIIKQINEANKSIEAPISEKSFKYTIILKEKEIDPIKIKQWMAESLEGKSVTVWDHKNYEYHFLFELEDDAMGFKLMWI